MEFTQGGNVKNFLIIRFDWGDLFLKTLNEVLAQQKIRSGIVTSGIGSLSFSSFHVITRTQQPQEDKFYNIETPMELSNIQGIVADGKPHLHAGFYDCANNIMYAGHIEPGCKVCYVELSLAVFEDINIYRQKMGRLDFKLV